MKMINCVLAYVLSVSAVQPIALSGRADSSTRGVPEKISRLEAEIEIFLLPVCRDLRSRGLKAGWVSAMSPTLNQHDYFFFDLYGVAPNHTDEASSTLGSYAVNKWTGDVWNVATEELVVDSELKGVQRILIQGHHINEGTLTKYRPRPLWAVGLIR